MTRRTWTPTATPSSNRLRARRFLRHATCIFLAQSLWTVDSHAKDGPYAVIERMASVLVQVEQNYVDAVDRSRLVEGATAGMVSELDPHSSYLSPTQFSQFMDDTQGRFAGLGVEVDFRDDQVTVVATMKGSPAELAGVKAQDRIIAVDGVSIAGERADKLIRRMRGQVGSVVKLTLRRKGVASPLTLPVTRAIVSIASVEGRLLEGRIAYVRLKVFQEGCYNDLLEQLAILNAKGPVQGLILDLRHNPGGLVSEAIAIADEFLDRGVIYSARHRGKVVEVVESSTGDALEKLKLLVLVDAATASSAEIVSGALQDRGRAVIVGRKTFGKGSVQNIIELEGGAGLLLTTLRYFTPKGHPIQAQGLTPDVEVVAAAEGEGLREADIEGHLATEGTATTRPVVALVPPTGGAPTAPQSDPAGAETDAPGTAAAPHGGDSPSGSGTVGPAAEDSGRPETNPMRRDIEAVPANPSKDRDAVLAKGYQLLLEQLAQ